MPPRSAAASSASSPSRASLCGVSVWVLLVGVAMRVGLVHHGHDVLRTRMELVAHHNSFLQVEEALFVADDLGKDPYAYGDFHQAPLAFLMFKACKVSQCVRSLAWVGGPAAHYYPSRSVFGRIAC
jgi:hypothetical protein